MEGIDFWRLSDELTVIQAALLICGYDPSELQNSIEYNVRNNKKYPEGYVAIKHALSSAAKGGFLQSRDTTVFDHNTGDNYVDDNLALINVDELKTWLLSKGVRKHFFFFPEEPEGEFLSKKHPRYSSKLAAAVRAWQAMDDESLHAKTPKQSVKKWLRLHTTEYGLSDDDGKPMESAIEEISKIVNWSPKGGAPSTPNGSSYTEPTVSSSSKNRLDENFSVLKEKKYSDLSNNSFDLDDEIPF